MLWTSFEGYDNDGVPTEVWPTSGRRPILPVSEVEERRGVKRRIAQGAPKLPRPIRRIVIATMVRRRCKQGGEGQRTVLKTTGEVAASLTEQLALSESRPADDDV